MHAEVRMPARQALVPGMEQNRFKILFFRIIPCRRSPDDVPLPLDHGDVEVGLTLFWGKECAGEGLVTVLATGSRGWEGKPEVFCFQKMDSHLSSHYPFY